jgi:hypothetical protein
MNLFVASLVVVSVTALAVAAMLLVRRRAPAGSYFEDGDRASGVFGVISTGFAVLVGFIVFLAFASYDTSRTGAETEASTVQQQFETAQYLPQPAGGKLAGELICYARNVVYNEWPAMRSGSIANTVNPWSLRMFRTLQDVDPQSAAEQAAYSKWLDQRSDRQVARGDRIHGAEGVIPVPLWIVLFVSAVIIFLFMLLFADSAERWFVQAMLMGGVAVVISATILLLWFLNNPYADGTGGLRPVAMQRTLSLFDQVSTELGVKIVVPCDAEGNASG